MEKLPNDAATYLQQQQPLVPCYAVFPVSRQHVKEQETEIKETTMPTGVKTETFTRTRQVPSEFYAYPNKPSAHPPFTGPSPAPPCRCLLWAVHPRHKKPSSAFQVRGHSMGHNRNSHKHAAETAYRRPGKRLIGAVCFDSPKPAHNGKKNQNLDQKVVKHTPKGGSPYPPFLPSSLQLSDTTP